MIVDLLEGQYKNPVRVETDIQFSESFEVDGREMYKHAGKRGLEGVVSKVRDSRYRYEGRYNDYQLPLPIRLV